MTNITILIISAGPPCTHSVPSLGQHGCKHAVHASLDSLGLHNLPIHHLHSELLGEPSNLHLVFIGEEAAGDVDNFPILLQVSQ